jgi:hypothetical protein
MSVFLTTFATLWAFFSANILPAVLIAAVGIVLIHLVMKMLTKLLEKSKLEKTAHKLIKAVVRIALYLLLALMVADKIGIDVTGVVALASVLTLAISLSVQNALANVIGGFTTEKTDAEPEALHAEAVEAMKKQLDADVWEEVKSEMLDLLMASLEARVVRIPLAEYNSYYDDVYAVELESFRAELADAENYGYTVPYSTVDEYIAAVTDGEFTSLSAFCTYYAEKQIANRILLFAMAEAIGERLNKEKNDELYRENIEYATKYYGWTEEEYLINYAAVNIDPALYQDASGKADRELAKRLAEKALRWRVSYSYHLDVVLAYVYENNTYVLPNE